MQSQIQQKPRLSGMIGFTVVWIGQIVSVLASGMALLIFFCGIGIQCGRDVP